MPALNTSSESACEYLRQVCFYRLQSGIVVIDLFARTWPIHKDSVAAVAPRHTKASHTRKTPSPFSWPAMSESHRRHMATAPSHADASLSSISRSAATANPVLIRNYAGRTPTETNCTLLLTYNSRQKNTLQVNEGA